MAVNVYKYSDASAPTMNGLVGIIPVLQACLVDGYGSKAAAGWTMPFTGTNKAVFRQGSSGRYLRVDHTDTWVAALRGYETMSDVDTGVEPFPTAAQLANGIRALCSDTVDAVARPWVVVADDRRFYLWLGRDRTIADGYTVTTTTGMPGFFFGDFVSFVTGDAYNTLIIGATGTGINDNRLPTADANFAAVVGHYVARAIDQVTLSPTISKRDDLKFYGASSSGAYTLCAGGFSVPDAVHGGLWVSPVYVGVPGEFVTRGRMPGLWTTTNGTYYPGGTVIEGTAEDGAIDGKTLLVLEFQSGTNKTRLFLEVSDTWEL